MTEAIDPDLRFANAGNAHHDAIQKLLQAFRDKSDALQAAQAAKVEAEAAKAQAEADKDQLSQYLEAVTANILAEIDPAVGPAAAPTASA